MKRKKKKKLAKKEKIEQEKLNELKLRQVEEELLTLDNPRTADQFDRLLLGSPNDSELWIKYMSFHLEVRIIKLFHIIKINLSFLLINYNIIKFLGYRIRESPWYCSESIKNY